MALGNGALFRPTRKLVALPLPRGKPPTPVATQQQRISLHISRRDAMPALLLYNLALTALLLCCCQTP